MIDIWIESGILFVRSTLMGLECAICGVEGSLTSQESMENNNILLAEDQNGDLTCLACYMERESICIHCGNETDLMPDTTCKAEPWLCEECLNLPYRVHMYSCYSDGCMTVEEFSEECVRLMEAEEEETSLFDTDE